MFFLSKNRSLKVSDQSQKDTSNTFCARRETSFNRFSQLSFFIFIFFFIIIELIESLNIFTDEIWCSNRCGSFFICCLISCFHLKRFAWTLYVHIHTYMYMYMVIHYGYMYMYMVKHYGMNTNFFVHRLFSPFFIMLWVLATC